MNEMSSASPRWGPTTKLIVGLTLVAVVAALVVRFRTIIGPLILAFMLAFLMHPIAAGFSRLTRLSWRAAVNVLYLLIVIVVIGLLALAGLAVVQQVQSLIGFVQNNISSVPALLQNLSQQTYHIGPFNLTLAQYDLTSLIDRLLNTVQTLLNRAGGLIGSLAASAATTVGWGLFVIIISYFLLVDTERVPDELVHVDIPGYNQDVNRLGGELSYIWNAYLRGQLTIIGLIILSYFVVLMVLGVHYAIGIALLAGFARFVPYLGPFTLWVVTSLVCYFQGGNYFGLQPIYYVILVVALAMLVDQVFDNLVAPRLMGQTLGVHPAALLIAAIIAANLIGLIGLILAAPVLASLKLLSQYTLRKMFDLDPWPTGISKRPPGALPWTRVWQALLKWVNKIAKPKEIKNGP